MLMNKQQKLSCRRREARGSLYSEFLFLAETRVTYIQAIHVLITYLTVHKTLLLWSVRSTWWSWHKDWSL